MYPYKVFLTEFSHQPGTRLYRKIHFIFFYPKPEDMCLPFNTLPLVFFTPFVPNESFQTIPLNSTPEEVTFLDSHEEKDHVPSLWKKIFTSKEKNLLLDKNLEKADQGTQENEFY